MHLSPGRLPPSDGLSKFRLPVGSIIHRGDTLEKLWEAVHEYRLQNNVELGDIPAEINTYYCTNYPSFCHSNASDSNASTRPKGISMLARVTLWAGAAKHHMPRGGYPTVTSAVAESRAAICAGCRQNVAWRGGCNGCSAATLNLLQTLKRMQKTKYDGSLMACGVGGWENSSGVWLEPSALNISAEQRKEMPAVCWRKKEA